MQRVNQKTWQDTTMMRSPPIFPTRRSVGYLTIAVLVVASRLAYVVHDRAYERTDKAEMERAAMSLARDGAIADVYWPGSGPTAHVSPLYAILLSIPYRIWGWDTVAGRIGQEMLAILATTIGICILPIVAEKIGLPRRVGWISAALLAILPHNLWIESTGTWEQPYAALVLLGALVLFCRLRRESWAYWPPILETGVLTGAAALLSPALLPAIILMIVVEWVFEPGRRTRVATASLVILALAAVILSPWVVRNQRVLGGFVPLRSNFGLELSLGNNPKADGMTFPATTSGPEDLAHNGHPFADLDEQARLAAVGELPYMKAKMTAALDWIQHNPTRAAALVVARFRHFWFPSTALWAEGSTMRGLKSVIMSVIGIAALLGLIRLLVVRQDQSWLIAAAMLGPSLIYMITHVDVRYRYPISGLSTLVAVSLADALWQSLWSRGTSQDEENRPAATHEEAMPTGVNPVAMDPRSV
jgi:hypothetical protein